MAKSLVIVESKAKAKTINEYLGKNFKVVASMGHVRDLPKSPKKLTRAGMQLDEGIDVENGFVPDYENISTRKDVIKELKAAAKNADEILVATDPDREGEAIGWHLAKMLGTKKRKVSRMMFNEITKPAVLAALKNVGEINQQMVDAQQARRVVDRLVGYKLSHLFWDKVRRGLSAGRVQSVALKLVCDREEEIEAFNPEEYWHVTARFTGVIDTEVDQNVLSAPFSDFDAKLVKKGKNALKVSNESEAEAILADLKRSDFVVDSVGTKERKKRPLPPFITSKLQQASAFTVKRTMRVAQELYEGIEIPEQGAIGLITYMRTDSTRVSEQALGEVREHIRETYGQDFLPETANRYKPKKGAQDAHEAIRPTSMANNPETVKPYLKAEQYSLYRLIWNRFVGSQMQPATFDDTVIDVVAGDYVLRAKGSVPKFSGWMKIYESDSEDSSENNDLGPAGSTEDFSGLLPPLVVGDSLVVRSITPEQKFTQPPARFSEATLVKELEENGIGRPSTYVSIIGTLQARDYVQKTEKRFKPRLLGRLVTDLLEQSFDDIVQVAYTRSLEGNLDKIEKGEADYEKTLSGFYSEFSKKLDMASKVMPLIKVDGIPTDEVCEKCTKAMVKKVGKFGVFLGCKGYPECTNTRELETVDEVSLEEQECENCGKPLVLKRGKFGEFLACSGYPECKTTRQLISTSSGVSAAKPDLLLDERCPKCNAQLVLKHGRNGEFTACSAYPDCRYVKQKKTGITCPKDGGDLVELKSRWGKVFYGCGNYPDCDFKVWNRPISEACPSCQSPFLVEKITKRWGTQVLCHKDDCDYLRSEDGTVSSKSQTVVKKKTVKKARKRQPAKTTVA